MSDADDAWVDVRFEDGSAFLLRGGAPLLSGVGGVPASEPVLRRGARLAGARLPATGRPARPTDDVLEVIDSIVGYLEPTRYDARRPDPFMDTAAFLLDGLLVRVVRGRGALDLALGDGLESLAAGTRTLKLGFSGIADYARERLGLKDAAALAMATLARKLQERPLLSAAVRSGDVSTRKAQVVLPVARGEAEAAWVERARTETARALRAAVSRELACGRVGAPMDAGVAPVGGAGGVEGRPSASVLPGDADDEPWDHLAIPLSQDDRASLDEAMSVAGELLGATTPRWRRLEAICEEYLGAHPVEPREDERLDSLYRSPLADWQEQAKEALERETDRWSYLERAERFVAPESPSDDDLRCLDAALCELARMRERWDFLVGQLAMLLRHSRLVRPMQFVSFSHYCEERLGVSARSVEQRAALARRLYELPALRDALRDGQVSYEQARLVARVADERTERAWIERARSTTCIALRRELEAREDAQMCARQELRLQVPARVSTLVAAALRAAREATGRWLRTGEALGIVARHFVATWKPTLAARSTPARRALARDRCLCQVPGCSRTAAHAHHVRFRSRGGCDEEWNLVSLCPAHHLLGIHGGLLRVHGRAPDALVWELLLEGAAGAFRPGPPERDGSPSADPGALVAA